MTIYANGRKDTVRKAFDTLSVDTHSVRLASPFFSYSDAIHRLSERDCSVFLIVRLGPGTNPNQLQRARKLSTVQVRFFTSRRFHTKLYIFGERAALVGSANLTDSGLQRNREVAVTVSSEDPDFEELVALYESYWSDAQVLSDDRFDRYASIWRNRRTNTAEKEFEDSVKEAFGESVPPEGIQEDVNVPSRDQLYLEDYRRNYQSFLQAFREIEGVYREYEIRKNERVPLRIEMDQFINFIRQQRCDRESWREVPLLGQAERGQRIRRFADDWFQTEWEYLDEISDKYPIINKVLGTPESIKQADVDLILEALWVCHAFLEQRRFHPGGGETFKKRFKEAVDPSTLRKSLTYLLHGDDEFIERMGALIYEKEYKIPHLGRNVVQELLGWVNADKIPICNTRTRKVVRCLGFDIDV